MQQILILGAGKSATILIDHLIHAAAIQDLFIHVADGQGLTREKHGSQAHQQRAAQIAG